jgi:hypothetical protein
VADRDSSDRPEDEYLLRVTTRQLGSALLFLVAVSVLLSAIRINPWVGAWLRGSRAPDYADAQWSFFVTAVVSAAVIAGFAWRVSKGKSWADGAALLVVMIAGLCLSDRYLLTHLRLSLWKHDSELHYRHRPGVQRTIGVRRIQGIYSINRWGHHDTEFPREKPSGEFRALMLGDSVTMGYGVAYEGTFSAHLEQELRENTAGYASYEVINTGVHGYSTYQELRVLEESLDFEPDFIAIGFCLNDVTEPFVVSEEYGGVGLDYHGVSQTPSPFVGWLSNETGFGRLAQRLSLKSKSVEAEKRTEIYNVRRMTQVSGSDPEMQEAWRITLTNLAAVYDLARENGKPIVLLVFPFTFQLLDESSREPQRVLLEHAATHGVDAIDFAPIFERIIFDDPEHLQFLQDAGYSSEDIGNFYKWRIDEYFYDEDHFTSEGNAIVAEELFRFLGEKRIVERKP